MRAFLAGLILLCPHMTLANDWRSVYQSSVESIPFISSAGAGCSGSLVADDRVLTAWHCVNLIRPVKVKWKSGGNSEERDAVPIYKDEDHDLTILKLNSPVKRRPFLLDQSPSIKEGQPICTIGHPISRDTEDDLAFSISSGIISKINKKNIITDMSISPGNSGGPVLTTDGKLLTVVSAKYSGARIGNIAVLSPAAATSQAVTVTEKKQTPLTWMDAKNTWYLYIPLGSNISGAISNDVEASSIKENFQEFHLEWRARDRLSISASSGGNRRLNTSSVTIGVNWPLPDFNSFLPFEAGAFVGRRLLENTEAKKQRYFSVAGVELSAYRSIVRVRAEHSIAADRPLSIVTTSIDLLSLFQ